MSFNAKQTSADVASLAAETLTNPRASATAKSLAASALAQARGAKQTGAELEELAGRVLRSARYSETTKTLAASVLAQANRER